ncbi:lactate utilization protein [bacterium]|nr:lactate utilization protein [candidate division CSSED10-310 bacterium]
MSSTSNEHIDSIASVYNDKLALEVIENLKNRRMTGYYSPTIEEARKKTMSLIPKGSVVTQGGSMTLEQTGIRQALLDTKDISFIDPYSTEISRAEQLDRRKKAFSADVFICSTNALTRDGILVNRDGIGNRVCAMAYGPEKVIIVCGINKIVLDVAAAIDRIDTVAAPKNCIRLNRNTPCRTSPECPDCNSNERICSVLTIIDWQVSVDRIHIVIVGHPLGF